MKGIKGAGVPKGTKCASIKEGWLEIENNICPSHKGNAILKQKLKWLLEVKKKGLMPQ